MKRRTKPGRKPREDKQPLAHWGANESPRHCKRCRSINCICDHTKQFIAPLRTVRYRACLDCGQRFSTLELKKSAMP